MVSNHSSKCWFDLRCKTFCKLVIWFLWKFWPNIVTWLWTSFTKNVKFLFFFFKWETQCDQCMIENWTFYILVFFPQTCVSWILCMRGAHIKQCKYNAYSVVLILYIYVHCHFDMNISWITIYIVSPRLYCRNLPTNSL